MKFKRRNRINQRIKRISIHHLVVGIDIAKEMHVAGPVNFRGMELGPTLSFSNDREGFERLMRWVAQLQKKHRLTKVIFGMESTGHFGVPLAKWLFSNNQEVVQVSPLTTKRNKENRDNRPSKNDHKDAIIIADSVSRGYYSDWVWTEGIYHKLRCAVNEQEALADDLASIGNRLQMLLDQAFPEFRKVFKDWSCPRAMATLKMFPLPEDLIDLSIEQIIAGWYEAGMRRAGGTRGREAAACLRAAARNSVGITESLAELRREIKRTVRRYEMIAADKETVEAEIQTLLIQVPRADLKPLEELGLGPFIKAVILANTGSLHNYEHGRQVLALAGLNLCECTSGTRKGQIVMSKRGRRQLRKYLYLAVVGLVANHSAFKSWHAYNVHHLKMKKQQSIFKLMGKLTRIIVALAHSGETFDIHRANPLGQPVAA